MAQEATNEEQRRKYDPREDLRQLRDECIDEIPPKIIHSHMLKRGQITDPDLQTLARQAIERFSAPQFQGETPTTREDINYANEVITKILGE